MTQDAKVIYLPSIFDPKKVREGVIEIINVVKTLELQKAQEQLKDSV